MVVLRVDEHIWTTGPWYNCYGIVQFRSRDNEGSPWVVFDEFHFGSHFFVARKSMVLFCAVVLALLGLSGLFGYVFSQLRRTNRVPEPQ